MASPLILCYHAVGSSWPSPLSVPEAVLAEQIRVLVGRGYVGLGFAEAERRRRDGSLPRRSVVVTFDDGYASTLRALPILEAAGFPATIFVVTSFVDKVGILRWPGIERWSDGPTAEELRSVSWAELETLASHGWEVGSHTVTHPRLPRLQDAELRRELVDSREQIAARLGRCETLCYPYGSVDDRVAAAAAQAGYICCAAGASRDGQYRRARIGLYPFDTGLRLSIKLSRAFSAYARSSLAGAVARARSARPAPSPDEASTAPVSQATVRE